MFSQTISAGSDFDIPEGFITASIKPSTGASFTFENSKGNISPVIDGVFTFPSSNAIAASGWASHKVTAIGASIEIVYATGA